ncbi:hypothetical protein PBRA_003963 [Plasmodiophora brassicae]|uniref:SURP motif domain-containing protein n=1 Tax=Plasmodiophora brassicae TaxID=37360 RepID=A0A0G4IJD8_PLABS|nr:hypothetical protein PBRA_003963 [Plasmodiophora brassicae]
MASGIRRVGAEGHASDDDVDVVVADEQVRDGFCVVGRPVRLVPPTDDADSFKLVMSERYLLPVSGNDEELADRYDARHLLDTSVLVAIDRFNADRPRVPADSEEESIYVQDGPGDIVMTEADIDQLQTERYIDLLIHKRARQEVNQGFDDAMRAFKRRQTVSERTLAQCRPPVQHECIREEHRATNSERFRPSFIVPSHITTLPESLEVHSLIEKTAKFARTNVPQAEVLLKIRQDHNPKFRFLLADDNLNPYYEYLKKTGVVHDPSSCRRLVSNYDSDDEQDPPAPAALPPTDAGSSASLPQSEIRRLRALVDARRRT